MYPALEAPGLAAGMAASALNLNGLGVMSRSVFSFFFRHILRACVAFRPHRFPRELDWKCILQERVRWVLFVAAGNPLDRTFRIAFYFLYIYKTIQSDHL